MTLPALKEKFHVFSMIFMLLNLFPLNSVSSLDERKKSKGSKSKDGESVVK
jgi:hypothetical protein